jgi:hypothetical protein
MKKKKGFQNLTIDLGQSYGEMTQFVAPYKKARKLFNNQY